MAADAFQENEMRYFGYGIMFGLILIAILLLAIRMFL
jgi:hypothetical protein